MDKMFKLFFLIPVTALLYSCGTANQPPISASEETNEPTLSPQGYVDHVACPMNIGDPHLSTSAGTSGYVKVNAYITCNPGDHPYTARVQMFLQKMVNGNWVDVQPGIPTEKTITYTKVIFYNKDANAYIPCANGTYRGRLNLDRWGSLLYPIIDPFKDAYSAPRTITCR